MSSVRSPGAVDISLSTKGQKPELDVQLDRGLAGSLGVTVGEVAQALRPAFAGIDVGDWIDPSGETRDVTIRLAPESRTSVGDLESLPLLVAGPGNPSASIPLGQVARITPAIGPARIDHLDRERVITVEANTEDRPLSEVVGDVMARVATAVLFPPGYGLSQGGETERAGEIFTQMFIAIGVAIMLMYFVLVVQFGSFLEPLSIMLSLPLSLIGVMLGAGRHRRVAEHHEHDRRDPAGRDRRQERDPADRLREVVGGEGHGAPRSAHSGRPRPPAADPDDDVRAGRRHGAGGAWAAAKAATSARRSASRSSAA